jgi:iron complex transport system ATP-binding protein
MELTETANAAIDINGFSFAFGEKTILENVSFSIARGEYVSIIGQNGAGKSTLLKCIVRILEGGFGSVKIMDRPVEGFGRKELARLISYVPQADGRYSPFTVNELVMMGRYPYLNPLSAAKAADRKAVERALEITGSECFADRMLNSLSGGERQKVFISAALAQEAEIMLLDEPTTFLDPAHQVEINRTLKRINGETGVTILSVTHDVNAAARQSGKIIALKRGKTVFQGSAEELMNRQALENIYDQPFLFVPHPQTGAPMAVPEER